MRLHTLNNLPTYTNEISNYIQSLIVRFTNDLEDYYGNNTKSIGNLDELNELDTIYKLQLHLVSHYNTITNEDFKATLRFLIYTSSTYFDHPQAIHNFRLIAAILHQEKI